MLNNNITQLFLGKIDDKDYFTDKDHLSKSWLDMINKSPAHLKTYLDNISNHKPTDAMIVGSMIHTYILEYDDFYNRYAISPDFNKRTNVGKEDYKNWCESIGDMIVITKDQEEYCKKMKCLFYKNPIASKLLENTIPEITVKWISENGVKCKAKADALSRDNDYIIDIKTHDGRLDFESSIHKYRYNVAHDHYTEGFQCEKFYLIVLSKSLDCCDVVEIGESMKEEGRINRLNNMTTYKNILDSGVWPGWDEPRIINYIDNDGLEYDL